MCMFLDTVLRAGQHRRRETIQVVNFAVRRLSTTAYPTVYLPSTDQSNYQATYFRSARRILFLFNITFYSTHSSRLSYRRNWNVVWCRHSLRSRSAIRNAPSPGWAVLLNITLLHTSTATYKHDSGWNSYRYVSTTVTTMKTPLPNTSWIIPNPDDDATVRPSSIQNACITIVEIHRSCSNRVHIEGWW